MSESRYFHTATALPDGRVLVAGGYNYSGPISSAEIYDPATNGWTAAGSMSEPRYHHTATALGDGRVLVVGSYGGSGSSATAEIYNPTTNAWTSASPMSEPRHAHIASILNNGRVLVAGGFGTDYLSTAEVYDPATNTWAAAGSMSVPRHWPTATILNSGRVLVAGGSWNSDIHSTAEAYDPATNTWTAAGSMSEPRLYHTATALGDGRVLVAGGTGNSGILSTADVYDPTTNTWTATGSMSESRYFHAAAVLGAGGVLVAGGMGNSGILSGVEIYDSASNTWTAADSMSMPRYLHTATALMDGRVLVAGGNNNSVPLSSAELFSSGNRPPVARAGSDQVVESQGASGASVQLNGSASTDPDGNIASYEWSENGTALGAGAVLSVTLLEGVHVIELKVTDSGGLTAVDTTIVVVVPLVNALQPAKVWVGLKNSDDVGIKFDLRAELYRTSGAVNTLIGSGELASVPGGSSGFNNAKLHSIPLQLVGTPVLSAGDTLSIKILVRNAAVGSGKNSGTARLWFNDAAADSHFGLESAKASLAGSYYLRNPQALGMAPGPGPRMSVDSPAGAKGSPFKPFGTWSVTVP